MPRVISSNELRDADPVASARNLLGKFLVRRRTPTDAVEARMITEVEAYSGECDRACHARAGRTARTSVLYQDAGVWYVYLCYGIHEMLNLVVGPKDWPAAILIRGVDGIVGPGRVTKQLAIDRKLNGLKAEPASGLWIEDRGVLVPDAAVAVTPRIGVDYAGEEWSQKPWRFVITKNLDGRNEAQKAQKKEVRWGWRISN
jgi:DNA-3-methyladenine glycosylase